MKLNFDNQYAALGPRFAVRMTGRPLPHPRMISVNDLGAALIDLDPDELAGDTALNFFSGAEMIDGADPLAMVYSGHQFGVYVPRLGDGRGLLLGQVRNRDGVLWDLHLKGAGQTPFSRGADGRAVLRSSIREYLASEALHHLGIPTSRALCLIGSDEPVMRERLESAAGLIRLSESHVRFGTFEYFYYTQQQAELKQLADYTLRIHFPALQDDPSPYDRLLLEVAGRTARMIAKWQVFGFAHGVMNTDNMSILGQTFDYGPYGFMEAFDPGFICNHSDDMGRYAFDQQPNVGLWNMMALGQALSPLILPATIDLMKEHYKVHFFEHYDRLMNRKLGLSETEDDDQGLARDLLGLLARHGLDYTIFFRDLSDDTLPETLPPEFTPWREQYQARLEREKTPPGARRDNMRRANPKYILRNYLAQTAIEKAEAGDFAEIDRLLKLLRAPYDDQPENESYAAAPPEWGRHLEVSCSS